MTATSTPAGYLSPAAARAWISRWDTQQAGYVPHREERFTAVIDAVAAAAGRADPLVLDLGAGPGSLAVRLLDQIPASTVIAVDADPLLLAVGRAAAEGRPGLRFADVDLRAPGWIAALDLDRPADAAVSSTALHWLTEPELTVMYADLAGALRPGGVLLNADRLADEGNPVLTRLGDALVERERERRFAADGPENWTDWWAAALADPALAGPVAERERRRAQRRATDHHDESEALAIHVRALRAAGFAEIGTLWQHGTSRVLAAVTPAGG
jgi:SAM-dependent methyltransferase